MPLSEALRIDQRPSAGVRKREIQPARPLNLLWAIDVDYSSRHHHGAMLRYLNYSRRLLAAGHRVYFLVESQAAEFHREREFFDQLKNEGTITDFFECAYSYPRWKSRLATLSLSPALGDRWLAPEQGILTNCCGDLISKLAIDLLIVSNRRWLFLAPRLRLTLPVIIDFIDSFTLYHLREMKLLWANNQLLRVLGCLRPLVESYFKERYYSRTSDSNIVVSPVDKETLDRINRRPEKNRILLNGVSLAKPYERVDKVKGRLIFSGNMNFPPNYESALWFIDNVFPAVLRAHPDAQLVIAGANPVPQLLNRASDRIRITGFIEDMAKEIAASSLYVAPMIMGGGFKNKVVEALINRTYVAAMPLAVEFLGSDAAGMMLVGDSAESLARHINHFLLQPEEFDQRLASLHAFVGREFSWERRTAQLLEILREVLRTDSLDRRSALAEALPTVHQ
jgi:glycosyltransferase involved in cell wall biosynthesis